MKSASTRVRSGFLVNVSLRYRTNYLKIPLILDLLNILSSSLAMAKRPREAWYVFD